jgi:hypothetical protein
MDVNNLQLNDDVYYKISKEFLEERLGVNTSIENVNKFKILILNFEHEIRLLRSF